VTSPIRATASIAAKAIVIGLVAAALYLPGLGHAPPYLSHDEALFGIQAHAMAATGRDASGNRLPLYFVEPGYEIGRDPLHVYLTALILQWQPLSESSIRAGAAGVGVVSIMLLFLLARRLFAHEWLAWLAAAILALTPVHYFHSRLGLSVIYPIPFVIGWLLCLVIYLERSRLGWLAASALALGAGAYSYLAALVMMPLYAVATAVVLLARRSFVPIVVLVAGFALPLSLLVAWHLSHPGRYGEIVNAYALYDADRLNPLQGLRDMTSYFSLGERVAVYWQAFNPGRWFFTGDGNLAKSTRQVGLFLMPVAILLPIGIVTLVRRRTAVGVLLLAGLVTAPLPEVLVGAGEVGRWLVVVPFVVLIATFGAETLWQSGNRRARMALVLLLVAMPVQFAIFHRDYMTGYRARAGSWFGGGNTREAVTAAIQLQPDVAYFSNSAPHFSAFWQFYALAYGRGATAIPVNDVPPGDIPAVPLGVSAAFITPDLDEAASLRLQQGGWQQAARVANADAATGFLVWSRPPAR
jgi:4-amino-4-deoxy-L-arabinose transferase-like glycosyltransferase